jgi:predicted Zn-dependent peptidase
MVISSVGDIPFNKLLNLITKYFDKAPANIRKKEYPVFQKYLPQKLTKDMDTFQTHIVLGNIAYDLNSPKRPSLLLLNNILGGPGMNSRLNMSLREKNGIAYNVESIYTPYSGTGVFCIYFGTDSENVDKSLNIVHRELKNLRDKKLGRYQLHNAKRQLKGQITISSENKENLMLSHAKSFLLYNKIDSIEEICNKIDSISANDLQEIANEIIDESKLSYLIYSQNHSD